MRSKILAIMKSYGGKLVEVPYTKGISSSALVDQLNSISTTKDIRRGMLKRLLISKNFLKIIEAHSPLSALVAEKIRIKDKDKTMYFDGFGQLLTDSL